MLLAARWKRLDEVEEMDIHESDWRVFPRLHSIALERFCKRVLEEVREAAECKTDYHDGYRKCTG